MGTRGAHGRTRRAVAVALAVLVVLSGCSTVAETLGASDESPGEGTEADAERELAFENATAAAGLDYGGSGTGSGAGNNGVYAADVTNDGWTDLLVTGGAVPALFVNDEGQFERRASFPNVTVELKSAAVVDYDGDGWDDVLLFAVRDEPVVLHNDGGRFERVSGGIGLGNLTYPLGAAAADYDGDGDRDLLVYQSGDWAENNPAGYYSINQTFEDDNGHPNVLYENTGEGGPERFERVEDSGIVGDHWSLAASFVDLTGDGLPDIHVANDYNSDTLYINQGDGSFEKRLLGGSTARNGMASEIADVNGDGRLDIFVTNIYIPVRENRDEIGEQRYQRIENLFSFVIKSSRAEGNTLLVNQGGGNFTDEASAYNVRKGGWGWAASLTDFDNDGDRDLVQATENVVRVNRSDPVWTYPMVWQRNATAFDRTAKGVHGMGEHDSRGLATLDYDHDGDRDVVLANYGGPYTLYENTVESGGAVQFEAVDESGATAHGARIVVEAGGRSTTVVQTGETDMFSRESQVKHVGLGGADSATLNVTWSDGTRRTFEVEADRRLRLSRDGVVNATALGG
jgi:uncharacterized protein YceK